MDSNDTAQAERITAAPTNQPEQAPAAERQAAALEQIRMLLILLFALGLFVLLFFIFASQSSKF